MRLANSTDFDDWFLRRMVAWCCRELGVKGLLAAAFTKYSGSFRGRAWCCSRRILIRIGGDGRVAYYPMTLKYPGRKHAPTITIADRTEALLHVTAHEVAHLARWQDGQRRNREARVDGMTLPLLEKFRASRDALLAEWNETPAAKPVKPKPSRAERNEAQARKLLAAWERKLKLAKTKAAGYRRKVRRYERVAARKGGT